MPVCVDCQKSFEHPTNRKKRCPECSANRRRQQWNSAAKHYQRTHSEKVRAYRKEYRDTHFEHRQMLWSRYYAAHGERIRAYKREQDRIARAMKLAAHDQNAWVVAKGNELQTCDRLRLTALNLPCGTTECCIGCERNTKTTEQILRRGSWWGAKEDVAA